MLTVHTCQRGRIAATFWFTRAKHARAFARAYARTHIRVALGLRAGGLW